MSGLFLFVNTEPGLLALHIYQILPKELDLLIIEYQRSPPKELEKCVFAITMGRGILAQGVHMLLPGRAGLTHVLGVGGCHHVVGRVLVGP